MRTRTAVYIVAGVSILALLAIWYQADQLNQALELIK